MSILVSSNINGDDIEFVCEPDETLLDALRDRVGLTGVKEGCGTGDCGACSITLDGALVCSCLVLGAEAEDAVLPQSKVWPTVTSCTRCSRNFWNMLLCSVVSALRVSWLRPNLCSRKTPTQPNKKCVMHWQVIFAAARATTKSFELCSTLQNK